MADKSAGGGELDWTFDVLRRRPDARITALDEQGFRIPLPDALDVPAGQRIPVPADRTTMIDLVAPDLAFRVVHIWERAVGKGVGSDRVTLPDEPDRSFSLTIIDQTHRYGVWVGILADADGTTEADRGDVLGSLTVSRRPRTCEIRKSWRAYITEVDDRAVRMLDWPAERLLGVQTTEFLHPDDHDRALASWVEMLSKKQSQRVRLRHRRGDGTWLWVEVENVYHHAEKPEDIVVVTQMTDISDEMAAYDALDRRERLFRRLAESLPTGLLQLDADGSIVYANTRLGEILGVPAAPALVTCLAAVDDDDRVVLTSAVRAALDSGTGGTLEVGVRPLLGAEERRCAVNLVPLTDQDGAAGALICVTDITDSARMRAELEVKATFDALTGCHNRASIMVLLERAIAADSRPPAVVFVDLNNFKPVNDTLGHAAGDELLMRTATALADVLREDDVLGRIGGDEFLVLCRRTDSPEGAMKIAERLRAAVHRPVQLAAGVAVTAASIGVAVGWPGCTADALVAAADAAMYEAKRSGTGEPVLHTASPALH